MADPAADVRFRRLPADHADAVLLTAGAQAELAARYGSPDDTPLEAGVFDPPSGAFFVGYVDGRPLVCGAWRRRTDVEAFGTRVTAEVKRMYVDPAARGRGLARAMLAHLEATARADGAEAIVLETGLPQPEAIGLYESAGYTPIPGFAYYAWSEVNRCFARSLL